MSVRKPSPGQRLCTARLAAGPTESELARRAGLDPSHMRNVEAGRTTIGAMNAARVAAVLGCSASDFL